MNANHLLIGLGSTGANILKRFRERKPALPGTDCLYVDFLPESEMHQAYKDVFYPRDIYSFHPDYEEANKRELSNRIHGKYHDLMNVTKTDALFIRVFGKVEDLGAPEYGITIIRWLRQWFPEAPMCLHALISEKSSCHAANRAALEALDALNIEGERLFTLFLYADRNEYGEDFSRSSLERMVADTVYFRLSNRIHFGFNEVERFFYIGCCHNELPYSLVEFDKTRRPIHTKAITSLGMARLVYPRQEIREHIAYTLLERGTRGLLYNHFKEGEGFANEPVPKDYREIVRSRLRAWKLSMEYLTLDKPIKEEDTYRPISDEYWARIQDLTYEEARTENPNPLLYLRQVCEEVYTNGFRGCGVESFYDDKWRNRRYYAAHIMETVRKDLFREWQTEEYSLHDVQAIAHELKESLRCEIQEYKRRLAEEITELEYDSEWLYDDYLRMGIIMKIIYKKEQKCYNQYKDVLARLYERKTRLAACEFADGLLEWIVNYVNYLSDSVQKEIKLLIDIQEEARCRIDQLEQRFSKESYLCSPTQFHDIEEKMICDQWSMKHDVLYSMKEYLYKDVDDFYIGDSLYSDGSKKIKVADSAYDLFQQTIAHFDYADVNLLDMLASQTQNDPEAIRQFFSDLFQRAGVCLRLNPDEVGRGEPGDYQFSEEIIVYPKPDPSDGMQSDHLSLLKRVCDELHPNWTWIESENRDELTIIKARGLFSIRHLQEVYY